MSVTGVTCSDEVINTFNDFKKSNNSGRFMILSIRDKKEIVIQEVSESRDYSDFRAFLKEKEPCYAVYKCSFKSSDDRDMEKVVFLSW